MECLSSFGTFADGNVKENKERKELIFYYNALFVGFKNIYLSQCDGNKYQNSESTTLLVKFICLEG